MKLYLNDNLIQSAANSPVTANWTAASVFDLGAYEYMGAGAYRLQPMTSLMSLLLPDHRRQEQIRFHRRCR